MYLKLLYHKIGDNNIIKLEQIHVHNKELEDSLYFMMKCQISKKKMLLRPQQKEIQVKYGDDF